jgi:hypothetical protein
MNHLFHAVRVPSFGMLSATGARHYGYAFAVHIGHWLVFCFPLEETP